MYDSAEQVDADFMKRLVIVSAEQVDADLMNSVMKFDLHSPTIAHDRVLLLEDTKFYIQSGYLTLWSDYFRVLFTSHFKEKNATEIQLKDVSAEEFNVFLQVIYPGIFEVQASHIESLIDLSYRFMAPNVLDICKKFVDREFEQLDKIMLLKVAEKHGMVNLKKKSTDYIASHVDSFDFIELLKLAFDYNLESVKKKLRSLIYTADRIELYYQCNECTDRIQRLGCTHAPVKAMPLTRNALIAEHIDKILILPKNIMDFIITSSISPY